tara:strand:- start:162 stop:1361 length:1200 start_codon:yes stop_codon:yes gene_type:complete
MANTNTNTKEVKAKDSYYIEDYTPLRVIEPFAWLGIVAVLLGLGSTLAWSIFGSVRQSITANSVVTYQQGLKQIYSPSTERIEEILVEPGEKVTKGSIIARLRSESMKDQVEVNKMNLDEALELNNTLDTLVQERLEQNHSINNKLELIYQPVAKSAQSLFDRQLITANVLAESKKDYLNNRIKYLENKSTLIDLRKKLYQDIIEKRGKYLVSQSELEEKYVVKSPFEGKIIDVNYFVGEYPTTSDPLATLQENDAGSLLVMATTSSGDIDRISKNDPVLFTPANIERSRYGGIIGHIKSIQRAPATAQYIVNIAGNKMIGDNLVKSEKLYIFRVELEKDSSTPSGYMWSSGKGPPEQFKLHANLLGKTTVYYDERRPITVVIPFIRSLVGLSDNPGGK